MAEECTFAVDGLSLQAIRTIKFVNWSKQPRYSIQKLFDFRNIQKKEFEIWTTWNKLTNGSIKSNLFCWCSVIEKMTNFPNCKLWNLRFYQKCTPWGERKTGIRCILLQRSSNWPRFLLSPLFPKKAGCPNQWNIQQN